MKKTLLIIIIGIFSQYINLYPQSTEQYPAHEEIRQYRIQYDFGEKVRNNYKMIFKTNVARTFEKGEKKEYQRNMEIYISYWRPSAIQEGFADNRVALDSIRYEYIEDKNIVKWFSQDNNIVIPDNTDFDKVFPILGRNFTATISPYFEVAKIESSRLTEAREDIEKMTDSILRWIWTNENSDINLNFYTDMNKQVLRSGRFALDSTWKMKFTIPIEGIRYTCDTANVSFYLYDGKNFNVKAEMPNMTANTADKVAIIAMNRELLSVDSTSNATGYWDISVSPRGLINMVKGEFNTTANSKIGNNKFSDIIKTEIQYEFLNSIKFKD